MSKANITLLNALMQKVYLGDLTERQAYLKELTDLLSQDETGLLRQELHKNLRESLNNYIHDDFLMDAIGSIIIGGGLIILISAMWQVYEFIQRGPLN